ncbi:26753_t:CDS:2, partial [Gigaspora margarita]
YNPQIFSYEYNRRSRSIPSINLEDFPKNSEQKKLNEALIQQLIFEIGDEVTWNNQSGPKFDSESGITWANKLQYMDLDKTYLIDVLQ